MEVFLASEHQRHPTELADLCGARFVTATELREGRSWDEQRIKSLTGGDAVTARYMHQDQFTFQPRFKLVFSGNHRPRLDSADEAIARRVHLVPFTHKPTKKDKTLKVALRDEYQAVLAWAIEGAVKWYERGLEAPACVRLATSEYLENEDSFGRWIDDCLIPGHGETGATELYRAWCEWCDRTGEPAGSAKRFAGRLADRQVRRHRSNSGIVYAVAVKPVEVGGVQ
jgi:putative DNA primase/helicase